MATSMDGYIADENGGVDWLEPLNAVDLGFETFFSEISTVIMGRSTYEQVRGFGLEWAYPGKTAIIVSSHPLKDLPPETTQWTDGIEPLIRYLRQLEEDDVWIVGGAQLQSAFFDLGALDKLDLFIIPVTLEKGVPLTPSLEQLKPLPVTATEQYDMGVVRKEYRF